MQWNIELPELNCSDDERNIAHQDYGKQAVELARRILVDSLSAFVTIKIEYFG